MDYIKYIKEQIKRLEEVRNLNIKMQNAKNDKKKEYYKACMEAMLQGGETIRNFTYVLEELSAVYLNKKETVNNLFTEIRQIKKLRV